MGFSKTGKNLKFDETNVDNNMIAKTKTEKAVFKIIFKQYKSNMTVNHNSDFHMFYP